jgi:hypothetical protein
MPSFGRQSIEILTFAVLTMASGLMAAEAVGLTRRISMRLVEKAVHKLPIQYRRRYREEWRAELDYCGGGPISMLLFALRITICAGDVARSLGAAQDRRRWRWVRAAVLVAVWGSLVPTMFQIEIVINEVAFAFISNKSFLLAVSAAAAGAVIVSAIIVGRLFSGGRPVWRTRTQRRRNILILSFSALFLALLLYAQSRVPSAEFSRAPGDQGEIIDWGMANFTLGEYALGVGLILLWRHMVAEASGLSKIRRRRVAR